MPSKDPRLPLRDILKSIESIEQFTEGMSEQVFEDDPKTVAAVERKLLTISEAAARLGEEAEALCPELPWRDIRGMGNWLRHAYERVDLATVWKTVTDDLPKLKSGVSGALSRLRA